MGEIRAPVNCAACGADIPPRAPACPECGADERTGWREQDVYDGLDLPDPDDVPRRAGRGWFAFWWIAAVVMVVVFIALVLSRRF